MIALFLAASLTVNGPSTISGPSALGVTVITVTQQVTIPCFVETDPPASQALLSMAIGIHKADYGTDEWQISPLDTFSFNVVTQKELVQLEQAYITNVVFPNAVVGDTFTGDMLVRGNNMKIISCPLLLSYHKFDNQVATACTNFNLPLLKTLFQFSFWQATSLPSLSLPALTNCNVFDLSANSSMTNFSAPLWLPTNPANINFTNCALNAASVNHILARCVANAALVTGTVNLGGGTSAAPTGQGVTDKNTLISRGVTVFTN